MRTETFWKKLFGFKVGDTVKIVNISDEVIKYKKEIIGRVGKIIEVRQRYLSKRSVIYDTKISPTCREVETYTVELEHHCPLFIFLEEDLELVT